MPYKGDEFHHFGWNACSSALSPLTGHAFLERRYLIIPGLRSSRIYVVDTKPDPTKATIHKIIEPEEVFKKTGYSRPHTVHCGPEGIYISTLGGGGKDGTDGPPGIFIMDCEKFDILGRWEIDRGPQNLHYDFWWNLPRDHRPYPSCIDWPFVNDAPTRPAGSQAPSLPSWTRRSSS